MLVTLRRWEDQAKRSDDRAWEGQNNAPLRIDPKGNCNLRTPFG